ncbi:MAG: HEPN domain-containing protein [Nanoarchaeota archaeon]|nr:HEPN domain-containing protein [Nanoarchaeota archaeon]
MDNRKFLRVLFGKKMLKLVEPSEDIYLSYIDKSESNLISSRILFDNGRFEESVSLSYYSMYNALLGLLFRVGIKSENHSGSIVLLKEIFDIDNSDLFFAKKERIDKQYYVDFSVVGKDAKELLDIAVEFKGMMFDFVSRLTNDKVGLYRERFGEIVD